MEHWILSVRTSLPEVCESKEDLKQSFGVYDSFEEGRDAFKAKMKEYALSDNAMFDGEGNLKMLCDYCDEVTYDDEFHTALSQASQVLKDAMLGANPSLEGIPSYSTDWMIAVSHDEETLNIFGEDDGPCNGYDPHISANIFDMNIERNLHLYIDDMFGQGVSSELYIDLTKSEN